MKHKKLWIIAFSIELLNVLLSYIGGSSQVNQCPRSSIMPSVSVILSLVVLFIILKLIVENAKEQKWPIVALGALSLVLVVGVEYLLWFLAYGGLDWCDYNFY